MSSIFTCVCFILSTLNIVNCAYIFSYMLHNPIASEQTMDTSETIHQSALIDLAQNDQQNTNSSRIRCNSDIDCESNELQMYCDPHYGYCDILHTEMELCRRDYQCEKGLICIFGKCHKASKPRQRGSRCSTDNDCNEHLCCARQHGESICKPKLTKGQRCYVPTGGLDYSLNELCPCDTGLICTHNKGSIRFKCTLVN